MLLHLEDSNLHIHLRENLISEIYSYSFYSPAFRYFFLGLNSLSTLFLNTVITCEIWDSSDDSMSFVYSSGDKYESDGHLCCDTG
jgi:hypothetical protein